MCIDRYHSTNLASELTTLMALLTTMVLDDCLLPGPPPPSAEEAAFSSFAFFLCIVAKFDDDETIKELTSSAYPFLHILDKRKSRHNDQLWKDLWIATFLSFTCPSTQTRKFPTCKFHILNVMYGLSVMNNIICEAYKNLPDKPV